MGKEHSCSKIDIDWQKRPSTHYDIDGILKWKGICEVCGRKVYEYYWQGNELYDDKTGEEI